ncbi:uncharacterized protein LOC142556450 [Primulina tabacum]|uniref:uncharacterized protein LOC142556450 n=1 Tax=Primulina tabacum TaxID=48773 RepID=UPI003F5A737A
MHTQRNSSRKLKKSFLVVHRLALLWARKGGVFRDKLSIGLTIFYQRIISRIHHSEQQQQGGALIYGDRQFSFDESPMIYIKMHRPASSFRFKLPNISCVRFDFESEEEHVVDDDDEEGIDLKAEEFIAKFREQMRLQRQMSCVHYLQ